jgi:hypothetical protein
MASSPDIVNAPSPAQLWCDRGFFVPVWCVLFCYSMPKDLWHNTLLVIGNGTFNAKSVSADFPYFKNTLHFQSLGEKNGVTR